MQLSLQLSPAQPEHTALPSRKINFQQARLLTPCALAQRQFSSATHQHFCGAVGSKLPYVSHPARKKRKEANVSTHD
jgi:hypothetical protein